ncbi:hypothetical protein [Streptomyces tauricus]|uniref:hypothetical protein n=1 Tax=Streptomyces tauricus TaxID=68274 RepID=UPI003430A900
MICEAQAPAQAQAPAPSPAAQGPAGQPGTHRTDAWGAAGPAPDGTTGGGGTGGGGPTPGSALDAAGTHGFGHMCGAVQCLVGPGLGVAGRGSPVA